jgi:hypothetical protein
MENAGPAMAEATAIAEVVRAAERAFGAAAPGDVDHQNRLLVSDHFQIPHPQRRRNEANGLAPLHWLAGGDRPIAETRPGWPHIDFLNLLFVIPSLI